MAQRTLTATQRVLIATWTNGASLFRVVGPHRGVSPWTRTFDLVRDSVSIGEFETEHDSAERGWTFYRSKYDMARMPMPELQGLTASALCEIISPRGVPHVVPSFSKSGYPHFVNAHLAWDGDGDANSLFNHIDVMVARAETSARSPWTPSSTGSDSEDAFSYFQLAMSELVHSGRVKCSRVYSESQAKRFFRATIMMSIGGKDHSNKFVIAGGIDHDTWRVTSYQQMKEDGSSLVDVLATGPTMMTALKNAKLVAQDTPADKGAWLDAVLESAPKATWAPGLANAIEPGRLLGSDPLMLRDAEFTSWIQAAGLQELATDRPPRQPAWAED